MSEEGKVIKFKFVVDEQSAQRVNRVLDEMIKRAQELAKTLASVSIGGGGGLMGGGSVGGRAPSAQSTMATAAGASTQKVSFASVLTQNVDVFKRVAQEGGTAMKALGDAVSRGADSQRREIFKLQQSLEALTRTYDRLGGASGKHASALQDKILGISARIQGHQDQLAKLQAMGGSRELLPDVPWPGTQYGPIDPGFTSVTQNRVSLLARFRGFLNQGGGIGAQEVSMANLGRIPGLGFLGSGSGAAIMGGATAFAGLGIGAARSQAMAAWNNQLVSAQLRAEFGKEGPSSYARKLRAGDLSDIRAMQDIMSDADKRREYQEIQDPGFLRRQGNRLGAFKDAFSERGFKEAFRELFQGTDGYNYQKNLRAEQRRKIDLTLEERGVQEDIFRDATSNALGKMGVMRALGIGGGYKKTGAYVSNSERFLNQFSQFDSSEVIGAVQGISGAGTRGAAYKNGLLNTVLQAQAAGINGAANIGGVFSRMGGASGRNMVDLLRSSDADVSTISLLGNYLATAQDRLNLPVTGSGALGALSFGTTGDNGAMVARQNIAGMENFQQLLAGSRDPAQAALNFSIARRSAPDAGYYAQQYLATKLDSRRIADVLGGDFELTPQERQLGITEEMLKQQVSGVTQSQAFRTMRKGFAAGSPAGDFVKEMTAGTNIRDIAKKMFGDDQNSAIETYATVLAAGNQDMSYSDALGAAREQLFGFGTRATKKEKGMKGDVAGGSIEAKQAREEAQVRETDRQLKDANIKAIEEQVAQEAAAYKRLITNSTNLSITANNIAEIIQTFAKNLKAAANGTVPPSNVKVQPK